MVYMEVVVLPRFHSVHAVLAFYHGDEHFRLKSTLFARRDLFVKGVDMFQTTLHLHSSKRWFLKKQGRALLSARGQ